MENQKYIVTLNPNGDIASIIDKEQNNFQILKEPVSLGFESYSFRVCRGGSSYCKGNAEMVAGTGGRKADG